MSLEHTDMLSCSTHPGSREAGFSSASRVSTSTFRPSRARYATVAGGTLKDTRADEMRQRKPGNSCFQL